VRFYPEYVHVNFNNVKKKREKTNTEGTSVGLLDLRQYYEKSSLAIFLSFVYLSSTLWGTPTTKVHDPVPWSDILVRRIMPHRVARLQQEVSGYLDLHDEQQILERITSQDWPSLAMIPTLDMGRGVMATRFFRSGSVVCDYHGPVLTKDQAESLRRSMSAAESNYMCFFKHDSAALHRRSDCGLCLPPEDSDHFWADGEPFRGPSEPTHGL
jgi:hypothetical protein